MKKRLLIIGAALMLVVAISLGVGLTLNKSLGDDLGADNKSAVTNKNTGSQSDLTDNNGGEIKDESGDLTDNNGDEKKYEPGAINFTIGYGSGWLASDTNSRFVYEKVGSSYRARDSKFIELVTSLDGMKGLCDKYNNPAFKEVNDGYIESDFTHDFTNDLTKKIREYGEEFYSNKALIVCSVYVPDYGAYTIDSLLIDENGVLNIKIARGGDNEPPNKSEDGMVPVPDALAYRVFLIEVSKADIKGVTDFAVSGKDINLY